MLRAAPGLSPRQKAAVVVRVMLADGADLDLSRLPPELQAAQRTAAMAVLPRNRPPRGFQRARRKARVTSAR